MSPVLPVSTATNIKQNPVSPAAREGINEVIGDIEYRGILFRTHSPYNSPVRPVRKWELVLNY